MLRITDQYLWNFVFSVFFLGLTITGAIILETEGYRPIQNFTAIDFILVTLATFRLIRRFIYDLISKFIREQFYDAKKSGKQVILEKPAHGPRRTLADLLTCPWCFGIWVAAMVVFLYALTPYAYYFVLFLAIAGVATFLQLLSNMIGNRAERFKNQDEYSN